MLARKVEPGQTVAASLQAPVLFTLAENLAQMELQVDVDEADVGQVHEGQSATFNVDAYAGRKYPASITRVGYGSQTKDGVVSYKTILKVSNDDLSLRPGMTAGHHVATSARTCCWCRMPRCASPQPRNGIRQVSGGSIVSSMMPRRRAAAELKCRRRKQVPARARSGCCATARQWP